jgi:hydrogenase assembly chaperone HypC/HupF
MCIEQVGQVVALPESEDGVAIVDVDGSLRRVSTALLNFEDIAVAPGDWLQSHTGLAVRILAEADALALIAQRRDMQAAADAASVHPGGGP